MTTGLEKALVDLLLNSTSTKKDVAQLLIANGVDIADDDLDAILKEEKEEVFEEVPYELSEDKTAFLVEDLTDKLSSELKKTFVKIPTKEEARFLNDIYYQTQAKRIAIAGQLRSLKQDKDTKSKDDAKNEENLAFLEWYLSKSVKMEENIKKALEAFSDSYYLSRWAKACKGIGPVLATALAANLEIKSKDMHAGNWWSYCGLNDNNRPWLGKEKSRVIVEEAIKNHDGVLDDFTVYEVAAKTKWQFSYLEKAKDPKKGWKKDELIKICSFVPYNKKLKVLCFKIGQSFRWQQNKPDSLYGRILREREEYEKTKNEAGEYAEQAKEILASKNFNKKTVAYKYYSEGKLPPAHINRRAERYATKLFISHLFEAAYYNKFGEKCPSPYIIGFDESGHNDYIDPEIPYESIERDSVAE